MVPSGGQAARLAAIAVILAAGLSCKADLKTGPDYGPVTIGVVQGDGQFATVGTPVAVPASLLIRNEVGEPVANVVVNFSVATGGGSIIGSSVTTGGDGIATLAGWTLGTTAGANKVTAVATGLERHPAVLTATGIPDAPTQIIALTPPPATARNAVPFPIQPDIRVNDQYGNAVSGSGVSVTATLVAGNGTLQGTATIPIDAIGVARFTDLSILGPIGTYTLAFSGPSLPSINGDVQLLAGQPEALALLTPPPGAARSGVQLTQQPVLELRDASNNPVPLGGVVVTATIASGGGGLTGNAAVPSDPTGIERFTNLAITGLTGTKVLQFSAPQLTGISSGPITVTPGPAALIAKTAGDNQVTAVGTPVPIDPEVTITDGSGNGVAGVVVTFTVTSGAGNTANALATTDAQGRATSGAWTLGLVAGTNTLSAVAAGLPASPLVFTATGSSTIGPPSVLVNVSGDGQTGVAGIALAESLVVRLEDASGHGVPGVPVTWTALSGGGTFGPAAAVTDGNGRLAARWMLGGTAGGNTARATAAGFQANFAATGVAGQAAQLVLFAAPATGQSGIPFTTQPIVDLQDIHGNPVAQANVVVTASILSGGGALGGSLTATTIGSGRATFSNLALIGLVGPRVLRLSATGVAPVNSGTIQLSAGAAFRLAVAAQPSTARSGFVFNPQPSIGLEDSVGNPVSQGGIVVTAAIGSGGGTLAGTPTATTAAGTATFSNLMITGLVGPRTLTFTAPSLLPVTSTPFPLTAGQAFQLSKTAGDNQTTAAGSAVPIDPVVTVTDASGNPVAGLVVNFNVTAGNGNTANASAITDAQGAASSGAWTMGPVAGPNTLDAVASGLQGSPAVFSATGNSGAANHLALILAPATGQSGIPFLTQPVVELQDAFGNPVAQANVVVTASILSGGGALGGSLTATTIGSGRATFSNLALIGLVGPRVLRLSATGVAPVNSGTIQLSAGAAFSLIKVAGDGQSAVTGTPVATDPSVQVTDSVGNPVANVTVGFAVSGGGGSIATGSANTDPQGMASGGVWILGPAVGGNSLMVTSAGLNGSPAVFSATGLSAVGPPAAVVIVSGATQSGEVGLALAESLVVRVVDGNGVGVPGVLVQWAIGTGGGSILPTIGTSDGAGRAAVEWTLGTAAGPNQATATAAGFVATCTATAVPGAGFRLVVAAQPSTARSGFVFNPQPSIGLDDSLGNPVPQSGVVVTAAVGSGGGGLGGTLTATTAAGTATFSNLMITGLVGPRTLTFTAPGLLPVTSSSFPLTAGTATDIARTAGDNQSAPVATVLPVDAEVTVTDASGNPVPGVTVNFTVLTGGGSIASPGGVTDALGVATPGNWTLGPTAGSNTLRAASAGLNGTPLTFTATGTPGSPASIVKISGDLQSGLVGTLLAESLVVRVLDSHGNSITGAPVNWTVLTGGGIVSPALDATDGAGLAATAWTVGLVAGPATVRAQLGGLTAVFAATILPSVSQDMHPVFSTYLGGNQEDQVRDITTDAQGNIFVTGGTASPNFPTTTNAYDRSQNGSYDVYVAKLDAAGRLVWSTFIGGPNYDRAYAVEVDAQGFVYVAGRAGEQFPVTSGVFQQAFHGSPDVPPYGPQDGFVCKLKPNGSAIIWCSYFGTDDAKMIRDLDLDAQGNIYLASSSDGGTFPSAWLTNAYQPNRAGLIDGVVAKVTNNGSQVLWATYIGGSLDEAEEPSLRVDNAGNVFVLYSTESVDAPAPNGFDQSLDGTRDLYVVKLSNDGSQLLFGTYLGGFAGEDVETHELALDPQGNPVVSSTTDSRDYPVTPGAYQDSSSGAGDGVITRISANGAQILNSTYLGGRGRDKVEGISIDAVGNVYVTGSTDTPGLSFLAGGFQSDLNGVLDDLIIVKLSPDLSTVLYGSYLGGSDDDLGRAGIVTPGGDYIFGGNITSVDFPTLHPLQGSSGGGLEGAVAKFSPGP